MNIEKLKTELVKDTNWIKEVLQENLYVSVVVQESYESDSKYLCIDIDVSWNGELIHRDSDSISLK